MYFRIIRCKVTTFFLNMQEKCKKVYKNLHICKNYCNFVPRNKKNRTSDYVYHRHCGRYRLG